MDGVDVGYECDVGGGDSGEILDFARVIGGQFEDEDLVVGLCGEDGKGQANKVVIVFRRLENAEVSAQDGVKNLPRSSFADRAGNCDDLEITIPAIPGGEEAE